MSKHQQKTINISIEKQALDQSQGSIASKSALKESSPRTPDKLQLKSNVPKYQSLSNSGIGKGSVTKSQGRKGILKQSDADQVMITKDKNSSLIQKPDSADGYDLKKSMQQVKLISKSGDSNRNGSRLLQQKNYSQIKVYRSVDNFSDKGDGSLPREAKQVSIMQMNHNSYHQDNASVVNPSDLGSTNQERLAYLETKYGPYKMISNTFKYEEAKEKPDFMILKFKDALYRGQIKDRDQREGMGVMVYENGRIFEGGWLNDRRHGKGYEVYSNGNIYDGEFSRGKANGQGSYVWKNGETYIGQWLNGQKSGVGEWKREKYTGDWKENKANGVGEHFWSTGDRYKGEWMNFLKHGNGTDFFANKDQYSGMYRYGKPCGFGKYTWSSGAVYVGEFEDGKKNGKGRWEKKQTIEKLVTNSQGIEQPVSQVVVVYYEGQYKNDLKEGFGEYKWASGNFYKGNYLNDKRHFYGEMTWSDGSTYKGDWFEGVQHGYGKMVLLNGEVKEGLYERGEFKLAGDEIEIRALLRSKSKGGSNQKSMGRNGRDLSGLKVSNTEVKSRGRNSQNHTATFALNSHRNNQMPLIQNQKTARDHSLSKAESVPLIRRRDTSTSPLNNSQEKGRGFGIRLSKGRNHLGKRDSSISPDNNLSNISERSGEYNSTKRFKGKLLPDISERRIKGHSQNRTGKRRNSFSQDEDSPERNGNTSAHRQFLERKALIFRDQQKQGSTMFNRPWIPTGPVTRNEGVTVLGKSILYY